MAIDIADQDTAITAEFDTDIDKLQGAEFFNDLTLTNIRLFGNQGAVSDGNAPITGGFNMFAPISQVHRHRRRRDVQRHDVDRLCRRPRLPRGTDLHELPRSLRHRAPGVDCLVAQNDTACTGNSRRTAPPATTARR